MCIREKQQTFQKCISQNNHTHSSDSILNQIKLPVFKNYCAKFSGIMPIGSTLSEYSEIQDRND